MTRLWRSHWARAVVVACVLTIAHTWPLATAPGVLSRNDNGDTLLNEWIMAWVEHQLVTRPTALFQGNIFYPAPDTLAFSEPLILPAVLGSPVRMLGGSPVLVHNLLLLAGLMLSMLAMYAVLYEWTRDSPSALIAGTAFAFNTHMLTRLAHVQALHAYGLPLAMLAADRVIMRGRLRDAAWLAAWMTAMAYTSGHFVIFAVFALAVTIVVRFAECLRAPVAVFSRFALATALSALAVLPLYLPYRRVAVEQGMVRSLDHVTAFSASLWSYVASGSRLHQAMWSARAFPDIDRYFPGFAVLALSVAAVFFACRSSDPAEESKVTRARILMLVAIAVAGIVLSLGTHTPIYGWLYRAFPPMSGIRAASRFGNLFLMATAALAGFAMWRLRTTIFTGRRGTIAAMVALAIVNVEALRAPFTFREFDGIPRLYTMIADAPAPVILAEQPFYRPDAAFMNAEYMLNSTEHWRPLMNGYSGFVPQSYADYAREFSLFPAPSAIDAMRKAGVTHVMVHPTRFTHGDAVMQICSSSPSLERLGSGRNGMTLYRLK